MPCPAGGGHSSYRQSPRFYSPGHNGESTSPLHEEATIAAQPNPESEPGTGEQRRSQYRHGASAKGKRTRANLIAAARPVFERDGYVEARVADIAHEAGVSHGTFYTYFESKLEIFRALITEVNEEMWEAVATTDSESDDYPTRLDLANRRFLDAYRKNAALMKLNEQQATVDPEVGQARMTGRRSRIERITTSLQRLQRHGRIDQDLDARTTAAALTSMVSNFAYCWYALDEPYDDELARATLTRLWLGAIGYSSPAGQ